MGRAPVEGLVWIALGKVHVTEESVLLAGTRGEPPKDLLRLTIDKDRSTVDLAQARIPIRTIET